MKDLLIILGVGGLAYLYIQNQRKNNTVITSPILTGGNAALVNPPLPKATTTAQNIAQTAGGTAGTIINDIENSFGIAPNSAMSVNGTFGFTSNVEDKFGINVVDPRFGQNFFNYGVSSY